MSEQKQFKCMSNDYIAVDKGDMIYIENGKAFDHEGNLLKVVVAEILEQKEDFIEVTDDNFFTEPEGETTEVQETDAAKEAVSKTAPGENFTVDQQSKKRYCLIHQVAVAFESIEAAREAAKQGGKNAYIARLKERVKVETTVNIIKI
jgi:hypothetical protein